MPIYEYKCPKCGKRFELRRSINESAKEILCPYCGSKDAQRVFSTFAMGSSGEACAPGVPT